MNGADVLVAALVNEGVTHVFGVPGERISPSSMP